MFPWTSLKAHKVEREKQCIARKLKLEELCDIQQGFSEIILSDEQSQDAIILTVGDFVERSTC